MIEPVFAPLGWLERFSQKERIVSLELLLKALGSQSLSEKRWAETVVIFQAACRALENPLWAACYLLAAARLAAQRGAWEQAGELAAAALERVSTPDECRALILWVVAAVAWQRRRVAESVQHWRQARVLLPAAEQGVRRSNNLERAEQLKDCQQALDRSLVEFAGSVESGYLLLDLDNHSRRLSQSSSELTALMARVARSDQRHRTYAIMETLEKSCIGTEDYPRAMVECAWTAFLLDNLKETIRYLGIARVNNRADRPNLAAVLWMMAAAYWMTEGGGIHANQSWQSCDETITLHIEDLSRVNSPRNNEQRETWSYLQVILRLVMQHHLSAYDRRMA